MTILPVILLMLSQCPGPYPKKVDTPIVRVESIERNTTFWGTGTCVASTKEALILTAWHVVREGHEFKIDGQVAKLVGTDKTWDLAALVIPTKMTAVSIGTSRPVIGDVLTVCGYGSGDYKESRGQVIKYFSPGSGTPDDILEMGAKARNGDSGGPIFDTHGILAAVLFGSDRVGAHGSCCTRVRLFIDGLNIELRLKQQALSKPYVIYGR